MILMFFALSPQQGIFLLQRGYFFFKAFHSSVQGLDGGISNANHIDGVYRGIVADSSITIVSEGIEKVLRHDAIVTLSSCIAALIIPGCIIDSRKLFKDPVSVH